MPPHHHGGHHGGGHHGGFSNWGGGGWGWGWDALPVQYVEIEQEETPPLWVWVAGGAVLGILLATMTKRSA